MSEAATRVLSSYALTAPALTPIEVGLINLTFRVEAAEGRFSLQRINPIFGPEVHYDIDAVCTHLEAKGLDTPRLVPTCSGALWVDDEGEVWRLMTWLDGDNLNRADGPDRARAAGRMLGRFHAAVQDLPHTFRNTRLGVHDTPKHIAGLEAALAAHTEHRLHAAVAPMGQAILQALEDLGPLPALPERVVHGDPKLNNIIFDPETGEGRALIDLDTLARMPLVLELGDAFRSWCNPGGEDRWPPAFEPALFGAGVEGYADGCAGLLLDAEAEVLVAATATIMLELAARFARDALEERYFGWSPDDFDSRGAHNQRRAEVQLGLARSLLEQRAAAERLVTETFRV